MVEPNILTNLIPIQRKLDYLEGIRGIAAFLVVLRHFLPLLETDGAGTKMELAVRLFQPFHLNENVHIFFILSGRVLTASILKNKKFSQLTSSILRRPLRLLFPCIGVLIFLNLYWHIVYLAGLDTKLQYASFREMFTITPLFLFWNGPHQWPIIVCIF